MKSAASRMNPEGRSDRVQRVSHHCSMRTVTAGYTLTELLIVLAVLVAVAALALPALQKPLDKSRLRNAGQLVRKGLSRARATAIREGAPLEFRFEQGGRRWKVERRGPSRVNLPLTATDTESAAQEELPEDELAILQQQTFPVRAGELPDGVIFAMTTRTEQEPTELEDTTAEQALSEPAADLAGDWSEPITFRPSGRTQDHQFVLQSAGGFAVTVSLRGLTSAISVGAPRKVMQSEEDISGEEAAP